LVTGFDIIFFWVARMMMMGLYFTKEVPFHTIYIHALVRDEQGQKMSKSKGNVIDPLTLIEKYGADSLRFTLSSMAAQGRDIKLSESRVEGYRNFITKIWNVARFISTYEIKVDKSFNPNLVTQDVNKWILGELNNLNNKIKVSLKEFKFNDASSDIYSFTWHLYCDWYIEILKDTISDKSEESEETRQTLIYSFLNLLKICHPFMPFVTEEINGIFSDEKTMLVTSNWPDLIEINSKQAEANYKYLIDIISEIRSIRSELRVAPSNRIQLLVMKEDNNLLNVLNNNSNIVQRMARISSIKYIDVIPDNAIQFNILGINFGLDLKGIINAKEELSRLNKELRKTIVDLNIVEKKLDNKKFLDNAPRDIIEKQRTIKEELSNRKKELEISTEKFMKLI